MVEKFWLDLAAALASEHLFLSLSTLAGWRNYESRPELETERCLCGAEGWGGVGWDGKGGNSCTLAPPCESWDDSCLSPKPRIASLPLFLPIYFGLLFHCLTSPTSSFWIVGRVRYLNLLQPDSRSHAHDPAPGPAIQAPLILPSHLLRPFSKHSALAASLLKGEVAEFCQHV